MPYFSHRSTGEEEDDKQSEEDTPWMYCMDHRCQASHHETGRRQGISRVCSPAQSKRGRYSDIRMHPAVSSVIEVGDGRPEGCVPAQPARKEARREMHPVQPKHLNQSCWVPKPSACCIIFELVAVHGRPPTRSLGPQKFSMSKSCPRSDLPPVRIDDD